MRRLLVDTNLLLEGVRFALELDAPSLARRLNVQSKVLVGIPSFESFAARAQAEFGELVFSAGSLAELDRRAVSLVKGNRAYADLEPVRAFWSAFASLEKRFECQFRALPFSDLLKDERETTIRFGPVDAHLIQCLAADREAILATTDRPLGEEATSRCEGRVLALP